MSGYQTPASFVDADPILHIDPRLLTDQVEVKNGSARFSPYPAILLHGSFGVQEIDKILKDR
jgi:hypothetical protein